MSSKKYLKKSRECYGSHNLLFENTIDTGTEEFHEKMLGDIAKK